MFRKIVKKSPAQLRSMQRAGVLTYQILQAVQTAAQPGMRTSELDDVATAVIAQAGATSNFYNYHGFPGRICVSVNEEIVHGIPGDRILVAGDLVSIDGGAIVDGMHGDSARTFCVGGVQHLAASDAQLSDVTEESMWAGIAAMASAARVGEIGVAIEDKVMELAPELGIVTEFTGHGIGTSMHMEPDVLNYAARNLGPKLRPGMCLCIEPMLVIGSGHTKTLADGWTVVSAEGGRGAHWEHAVALHADGLWVLTAPDGGAERLAAYGVQVAPPA